MNKLQAAHKIAEAVNNGIKKTFLGFDEDTLRLISALAQSTFTRNLSTPMDRVYTARER